MEVCPQQHAKFPWCVSVNGKCMESFPTQSRAIAVAVEEARLMTDEGRQITLKIKRRDGTIRDERTYPRSSDPVEIRG